jgi:hypothetical protein
LPADERAPVAKIEYSVQAQHNFASTRCGRRRCRGKVMCIRASDKFQLSQEPRRRC